MNIFNKIRKGILCNGKKFLGFSPLSSKINNKFPLLTAFQIYLFVDFLFSLFYLAMGVILQGTFFYLTICHGIYMLINVIMFNNYSLFDCSVLLAIYLVKLYLVGFYQLFYFIITKYVYVSEDQFNYPKLDIEIIIMKTLNDVLICYIIWSLYRRIKMNRKIKDK